MTLEQRITAIIQLYEQRFAEVYAMDKPASVLMNNNNTSSAEDVESQEKIESNTHGHGKTIH